MEKPAERDVRPDRTWNMKKVSTYLFILQSPRYKERVAFFLKGSLEGKASPQGEENPSHFAYLVPHQ